MADTFRVVPDELRAAAPTGKYVAEVEALVEGKTIFVPGLSQTRAATFYAHARRRNRVLHTRTYTDPETHEDGLVLWMTEPVDTEPDHG